MGVKQGRKTQAIHHQHGTPGSGTGKDASDGN